MIDTAEQTTCKSCGKPLEQASRRGPRKREYCNATCRQRGHRKHQARFQEQEQTPEARIATLENEIQKLQARLNVEERFRTDTQVRHFKSWLRTHPQPRDYDLAKRFLDDTHLPQHASKALYTARLKLYGYSTEDIYLFEETWKDMLFTQS